jgi:hypothetical protein
MSALSSPAGPRNAVHYREIAAIDRMRRELLCEAFMGDVGLGDDQKARRVLVDAVDDARPGNAADPRQTAGAMVKQRIDQSPVEIAGGGMDDQPRRLVDDEQVLVLEEDGQRDVLRFVMRRRGLRNREAKRFAAFDLESGIAHCRALRLHSAAADQGFEALARKGWNGRSKRTVETPAGMGRLQAHVDRLKSPHLP